MTDKDNAAPVADELPHWKEISAKMSRNESLTPLELFIHENEPAGGDADAWREQLAAALASAPVAREAEPFAVLAVHKNGEIRSYSTGQALKDAPIQDSERELQRKYGYELVTVYAAPQASKPVAWRVVSADGRIRTTYYESPDEVRLAAAKMDGDTIVPMFDHAAPQASEADDWQSLAASVYQAAAAYDMPVRFLDALSIAANGEKFAHLIDGLLPVEWPKENDS